MSMLKKLINKASQVVRLFSNTTKRDGSKLEEVNHNLRGTMGEHTLSIYPNRERCYIEVSRPIYAGSTLWCKGYITLSFHSERMDGETQVNVGTLQLPNGRTLKVELRDVESHSKRDSDDKYQAYTLAILGGNITTEDCEAAINSNTSRLEGAAAAPSYKAEEVTTTPTTEGTIAKKTGDDIPF